MPATKTRAARTEMRRIRRDAARQQEINAAVERGREEGRQEALKQATPTTPTTPIAQPETTTPVKDNTVNTANIEIQPGDVTVIPAPQFDTAAVIEGLNQQVRDNFGPILATMRSLLEARPPLSPEGVRVASASDAMVEQMFKHCIATAKTPEDVVMIEQMEALFDEFRAKPDAAAPMAEQKIEAADATATEAVSTTTNGAVVGGAAVAGAVAGVVAAAATVAAVVEEAKKEDRSWSSLLLSPFRLMWKGICKAATTLKDGLIWTKDTAVAGCKSLWSLACKGADKAKEGATWTWNKLGEAKDKAVVQTKEWSSWAWTKAVEAKDWTVTQSKEWSSWTWAKLVEFKDWAKAAYLVGEGKMRGRLLQLTLWMADHPRISAASLLSFTGVTVLTTWFAALIPGAMLAAALLPAATL